MLINEMSPSKITQICWYKTVFLNFLQFTSEQIMHNDTMWPSSTKSTKKKKKINKKPFQIKSNFMSVNRSPFQIWTLDFSLLFVRNCLSKQPIHCTLKRMAKKKNCFMGRFKCVRMTRRSLIDSPPKYLKMEPSQNCQKYWDTPLNHWEYNKVEASKNNSNTKAKW